MSPPCIKKTEFCCCCSSLKTGITVLGVWEIIVVLLMSGTILSVAFNGVSAFNVVPYFVKPLLVDFPRVIGFIYLLCLKYNLKSRYVYYRVRYFTLIFSAVTFFLQVILAWVIIFVSSDDYYKSMCGTLNTRGMCATTNTVWISVFYLIEVLLNVHYLSVAYTFWYEKEHKKSEKDVVVHVYHSDSDDKKKKKHRKHSHSSDEKKHKKSKKHNHDDASMQPMQPVYVQQ